MKTGDGFYTILCLAVVVVVLLIVGATMYHAPRVPVVPATTEPQTVCPSATRPFPRGPAPQV